MLNAKFLVPVAILVALLGPTRTWAQRITGAPTLAPPTPAPSQPDIPANQMYGGSLIGVGDILDIRVNDEDDVSGHYQVNQEGKIELPLLSKPLDAAGVTTFDLSKNISNALVEQQILRAPSVTVFIAREMGQNVTVLGPVARPGMVTLERPTTLIELISLAGGLQPSAGQTLTISSKPVAAPGTSGTDVHKISASIVSVNIADLMSGKNPDANVLIHAGDVVAVATAPVVYVVGAVAMPGAFTIQDSRSSMTVLKAIAMADGAQPTAALSRAIIVRHSSSDTDRQEIPLDLKKIITAKETDQVLESDDILFVPQSALKAGLHRMGDIAVVAAGATLGYGLGLRISR